MQGGEEKKVDVLETLLLPHGQTKGGDQKKAGTGEGG
jgi:hypothetical protein